MRVGHTRFNFICSPEKNTSMEGQFREFQKLENKNNNINVDSRCQLLGISDVLIFQVHSLQHAYIDIYKYDYICVYKFLQTNPGSFCFKDSTNHSKHFLSSSNSKFLQIGMVFGILETFLDMWFSKFSTLLPKEPSFPLAHLPCFRWVPRPNQKNMMNQIWHLTEALFLFSAGTSATQRQKNLRPKCVVCILKKEDGYLVFSCGTF